WCCQAYCLAGFCEQRGTQDERIGAHDETRDARRKPAKLVTVGDYLAVSAVRDVVPGSVFAFDHVGRPPGADEDDVGRQRGRRSAEGTLGQSAVRRWDSVMAPDPAGLEPQVPCALRGYHAVVRPVTHRSGERAQAGDLCATFAESAQKNAEDAEVKEPPAQALVGDQMVEGQGVQAPGGCGTEHAGDRR